MAQPATYGYQQPATGFHRVIIVGLEAHKSYAEERRHGAPMITLTHPGFMPHLFTRMRQFVNGFVEQM